MLRISINGIDVYCETAKDLFEVINYTKPPSKTKHLAKKKDVDSIQKESIQQRIHQQLVARGKPLSEAELARNLKLPIRSIKYGVRNLQNRTKSIRKENKHWMLT